MNMSEIANNWTPTKTDRFLSLDVPGGKEVTVNFSATPGPDAAAHLPTLLIQAVRKENWKPGVLPAGWMLWELLVSENKRGVVSLDGKGPKRRVVEPLRSAVNDWTRGNSIEMRIRFNPMTGDFSLISQAEAMSGTCFLKTTGDWVLVLGCPEWYRDLSPGYGWSFSASWSLAGGEPAPLPPTLPPVDRPQPIEPPIHPPTSSTLPGMHWQAMLSMQASGEYADASWPQLAKEAGGMVQAHIDWVKAGGLK